MAGRTWGLSLVLGLVCQAVCVWGNEPLADSWQQEYSESDARASHVIALWQFHEGRELEDSSGNGHTLTLAGAKPVADGKFGGGLRSFAGWPVEDKKHAAVAQNHASLSPTGAFTIDLWLKPADNLPAQGALHLLCKKYVSHNDYQLALIPAGRDRKAVRLTLGFGDDSENFTSDPADWPAEQWQHLAVTYDGAGTVRFYRNGGSLGEKTVPSRRSISPGRLPLTLADRTGSHYGGFPGVLDEVRICRGVREFSPASLSFEMARKTWIRMEPQPEIRVTVQNQLGIPLQGAELQILGLGQTISESLPDIPEASAHVLTLPFDTALRPGEYEVRARLEVPGEPVIRREQSLTLQLRPRPLPGRMPVLMWGMGSPQSVEKELPRLRDLGFTHCLGFGADYGAVWKAGEPTRIASPEREQEIREMLDLVLAHDFGIAANLSPMRQLSDRQELLRVDREGNPYERKNVNAALPGLQEYCENVGLSVARTFGDHPAFQAAMINTEVRDGSQVSFSEFDHKAYRAHSGREIPEEVRIKNGVQWGQLPNFPADRVIPDDHPVLDYYRWFWTTGDGWNGLHSAVHRGLKGTGREDFWTWFDPTIRAPSIAGSGGSVDVLSQWTYTEPSPLRVGYFADEMFEMARLSPTPQQVMKMTQLFWYRTTSAPIKSGTAYVANPFDDHDPDAAYITIAPAHLRQSFWTKIARPVSGLMYHGWGSLVPTDGTSAYKFTQPDTQTEFRRLHREILEPLGPMLLQVPDRPTDVAYLNSFTAQMFARRGSYGYSHDEAYLTLLHAQLQPRVMFEESLLKEGLAGYRILVLVDCDVLPRAVVDRIQEFQQNGGLIIGDPNLAPAIQPDLVLPRFTRKKQADSDKATLLENAARLREELARHYRPPVECSHPDLIPRRRGWDNTDYIFVVNDQREAGHYVGQHGLVQEQGLPTQGTLTLRRPQGHVYDLLTRRAVSTKTVGGDQGDSEALVWPVDVPPSGGKIFLVTERPIEQVRIEAPDSARLGEPVKLKITVTDSQTQPVDAAIPVEVRMVDPHGRPAEYSGYHATTAGQLPLTLDLATNDTPGTWTIQIQELATGQQTTHYLRVEGPK